MMVHVLGYVAMVCLITAAFPQALKAIRDGQSNGVSGAFLVLLLSGFSLMSLYLILTKPVYPVLINYLSNILMMGVVAYYKLFPRVKP
jgi:uncharacterized protein with PQ loop repeat